MIQNAQRMQCGNCGGDSFMIYSTGGSDYLNSIICECRACKSTTVIAPTAVKLDLKWGEGSNGRLAIFPAPPDKGGETLAP